LKDAQGEEENEKTLGQNEFAAFMVTIIN
jgi:hypothetical protein